MKNIFVIICSLFFGILYSQEQKAYIFYVELDHYSNAPKFEMLNKRLIYTGKDADDKAFFSQYTILDFFQAFPDSEMKRTLNVFMMVSYNKDLMNDMVSKFPHKYLFVEDMSDLKTELIETYPNDYGTTSPVANFGIQGSLKTFDYINVPKAWDYTMGQSNVKIGISDTKIDIEELDFKYKTSFMAGYGNQNSLPYDPNTDNYHGTGVAGVAAAQGGNYNALSGVCSNCSIVATSYLYGSPGTYLNPNPALNYLLQLAKAGVKVINMSWRRGYSEPRVIEQWIFDEIHDKYDVVLVAGAGNENGANDNYYTYPASYNHVISVSSVNHKNNWNEQLENNTIYGPVSWYVADQIRYRVAPDYIGDQSALTQYQHTYNKDVDICAPGYQFFRYSSYVGEGAILYGDGTSGAAPHVSGTIGLMFSVNECLKSDEVEDILQLTSKNLENIPGNELFAGKSGSGKLEAGDAVQFVFEMKRVSGNAKIDGNDFYRFNFELKNFLNKLTISNQIFRDKCTADFTAKNVIEILPGSDFKPNATGFVDLKINSAIVNCGIQPMINPNDKEGYEEEKPVKISLTKLYPNPNNGTFEIVLGREVKEKLNVEVYDIFGKAIYKTVKEGSSFAIDIPNLATGMYIVKINSGRYNETIKFIKE